MEALLEILDVKAQKQKTVLIFMTYIQVGTIYSNTNYILIFEIINAKYTIFQYFLMIAVRAKMSGWALVWKRTIILLTIVKK